MDNIVRKVIINTGDAGELHGVVIESPAIIIWRCFMCDMYIETKTTKQHKYLQYAHVVCTPLQ